MFFVIQKSKAYDLNIETKVYLDNNFAYKKGFTDTVNNIYRAGTENANMSNSGPLVTNINEWVSKVTAGRITELVSEGQSQRRLFYLYLSLHINLIMDTMFILFKEDLKKAALVLLNAVYFKGQWRYQFPKNDTTTGGFYLSNQKSVTVNYMTNEGEYYYHDSMELDAKILRMPYKVSIYLAQLHYAIFQTHLCKNDVMQNFFIVNDFQESPISMFILLPNSKAGLERLIRNVNSKDLRTVYWLMDKRRVEVILPKFHFSYKSKFNKIFQNVSENNGYTKILDI